MHNKPIQLCVSRHHKANENSTFYNPRKVIHKKISKFLLFHKKSRSETEKDLYLIRYGYLVILKCFDHVIRKQQMQRIQNSNFYSLIIDESTDFVFQKEMIIYIRYYDQVVYEIKTESFGLIKFENFTSKGIFDALIRNLFFDNLFMKYIRLC